MMLGSARFQARHAKETNMKLNFKKVFFVGMAFFVISLFWQTYDSIITKILIDKFGLNQTWSGVVMAFDNVLALFLLPLFGGLSDKTNTKMGRRTPYIIVGTVIAAFAFVLLSFTDNLQTVRIESDTSIIADYDAALAEKAIMLDAVGKTESKKAAALAAGDITQTEYDEWKVSFDEIVGKWYDQIWEMQATNELLFEEGTWSAAKYDRWEVNVFLPMEETVNDLFAGREYITQAEYSYWSDEIYDGVYDAALSASAWELTMSQPAVFIVFSLMLFIALVSMSVFRSPAVALMPDVTIKPLRSKANAVINLMGTFGGIFSIVILAGFGLDSRSYVNYTPAFVVVGVVMLAILAVFLWKVKEPKMVAEKLAEDKQYGLTDEEEEQHEHEFATLAKDKKRSLALILISVFLWFIGYNAVTTKLSDYAPKVLGMGFSLPLLIAQGAALVAFIPIGIVATKIGRRKTILIGITILSVCFGSVFFLNESISSLMYVIFAFTGIGWATINVNSYPMVVELSKGSNVGKYTGYYYTFSMAAQILTPILSGILMDELGRKVLFPYATLFVAAAFVTMFFVRHGDAKVIEQKKGLESFDVDMD
jgi:Na+/melibiose symporter-like transporter